MDNTEIIDELKSLSQIDIDATRAYSQAIDEIDIKIIRDAIEDFRKDHERHIYNLNSFISRLGGTPPEVSPDLKGFLIEGFTMIRSKTGTEGALKAMETNEKLTNKDYRDACSKDFPSDILDVLRSNYEDEQRHLSFIQEHLKVLQENPAYYERQRPGDWETRRT